MNRRDAWLLAPGAALAAGAAVVWLATPQAGRPLDAALIGAGVMLIWAVAASLRQRYPQRPLWVLLCALATAYALQVLVLSPSALLFTLGRAARPLVEVLLIWVMVAFPTGRLGGWRERALVLAAMASVLFLWLPGMMFSPRVPLPGPFVTCGDGCPANLLFLADRPAWADGFLNVFRVLAPVILLATTVHLGRRLQRASALMRRALAPVLLASIARLLNMAAFVSTGGALLALTFTLWAVPLALAWGLLRGRLYTARVLQRLVSGLRRRPGPQELRDVMARALDDPGLIVGYWRAIDAQSVPGGLWVDGRGEPMDLVARNEARRPTRMITNVSGKRAAILVHDPALLEEPALLDSVADSMQAALVSHQAEVALADQRASAVSAVEEERRRIERDLHDGAQQRLLALRMKLGVGRRLLEQDRARALVLLREMDADMEAAIQEIRTLAHGIVPPVLAERGLAGALAELAAGAALPVRLNLQDVGRLDPAIERAVFFVCAEGLQNAAKHAGPRAQASLTLNRTAEELRFEISDTGQRSVQGLPTADWKGGLQNMRERLDAAGGWLEVGPAEGEGFGVSGGVPLGADLR